MKIYRVRKECARRDIKVRLLLTKRRQSLLNFAQTHLENEPNFKFVYADEDGNLKVRTKEPVGRKFVFSFNNEKDIAQLINRIDVESEAFQVLHSDFEVFDNQSIMNPVLFLNFTYFHIYCHKHISQRSQNII